MIKKLTFYFICLVVLLGCEPETEIQKAQRMTKLAYGELEVCGDLIDVRSFEVSGEFYPQNSNYILKSDINGIFTSPQKYAVSLKEKRGPQKVRMGNDGELVIASQAECLGCWGWHRTGDSFVLNELTYYVHAKECKADEWEMIPHVAGHNSSIVFGRNIRVVPDELQGKLLAKVDVLRGSSHVSNAAITILPDGTYLASCTGVASSKYPSFFQSRDKGETWTNVYVENYPVNGVVNYLSLFVHKGALYILGCTKDGTNMMIQRSDDGGRTWTVPSDANSGLISTDVFHGAVVPVVESKGRRWRAAERARGTDYSKNHPVVLSCPVDADLLKASNWTIASELVERDWNYDGHTFTSFIEGNAVVGKDGEVYDILRANASTTTEVAAKVRVTSATKLDFKESDFINMPGGGKKFVIRYDSVSDMYWALTNPAEDTTYFHSGMYYRGLDKGLMRNWLVLCCSRDLVNWEMHRTIVYCADPFFHGYQYADWMFDGNDIIAVCRTGAPEERGLPSRQHDANLFTFHKIKNFRDKE